MPLLTTGAGTFRAVSASPAYLFRGVGQSSANSDIVTFSIDIGTASADRLVIVGVGMGVISATIDSVVVNGFTLTQDVSRTTSVNTAKIYSGLVTTGSGAQNVVINTTGAAFQDRGAVVWTATGLSSNVVKNTAGNGAATININVTAGDFLFGLEAQFNSQGGNYTSSTEAPAGTHPAGGSFVVGADWTVVSTNASFAVTYSTASQQVAASYR